MVVNMFSLGNNRWKTNNNSSTYLLSNWLHHGPISIDIRILINDFETYENLE
jgi:hypothetical protein